MDAVRTRSTECMPDKPELIALLRQSAPFRAVPDSAMGHLRDVMKLLALTAGQTLYVQGDPGDFFYLVVDGRLNVYRRTVDGHPSVSDIIGPAQLCGEDALFDSGCYAYTAEAIEDARVLQIPLRVLRALLAEHQAVAWAMMEMMNRRYQARGLDLEHRTFQSTAQRLGCAILRLCAPQARGQCNVTIPYEKGLFALSLGMQPETLSRALARLSQDTGIIVRGTAVHIPDIGRLSAYCCKACAVTFPCYSVEVGG